MSEHSLNVRRFKRTCGFVATCSCGAKIARATGCNRSGAYYALANAQEKHAAHVATLATPAPDATEARGDGP